MWLYLCGQYVMSIMLRLKVLMLTSRYGLTLKNMSSIQVIVSS
jgi:hypothetical protein